MRQMFGQPFFRVALAPWRLMSYGVDMNDLENLTPGEAWDVFVGAESPALWHLEDVPGYVAGSPLTSDLGPAAQCRLVTLLSDLIQEA